jgi:hypothetical protein
VIADWSLIIWRDKLNSHDTKYDRHSRDSRGDFVSVSEYFLRFIAYLIIATKRLSHFNYHGQAQGMSVNGSSLKVIY